MGALFDNTQGAKQEEEDDKRVFLKLKGANAGSIMRAVKTSVVAHQRGIGLC